METSTLVLTALLQLNNELINDDGFCGYNDDYTGNARLLDELWEIYCSMTPAKTPQDLVDAWYDQFYASEEAA